MRKLAKDSVELILHRVSTSVSKCLEIAGRPIPSDLMNNVNELSDSMGRLMAKASRSNGTIGKSEASIVTNFNSISDKMYDKTYYHNGIYTRVDHGSVNSLMNYDTPWRRVLSTNKKSVRYCKKVINNVLSHAHVDRVNDLKRSCVARLRLVVGTNSSSPSLWVVLPIAMPINEGANIGNLRSFPLNLVALDSVPHTSETCAITLRLLAFQMLRMSEREAFYLSHESVGRAALEVIETVKVAENYPKIKEILGEYYSEIMDSIVEGDLVASFCHTVQEVICAVANTLLELLAVRDLPIELMQSLNVQPESSTSGLPITAPILISSTSPQYSRHACTTKNYLSLVLPTNAGLHQILEGDFSIGMEITTDGISNILAESLQGVRVRNAEKGVDKNSIPGVSEIVDSIISSRLGYADTTAARSHLSNQISVPSYSNGKLGNVHDYYSSLERDKGVTSIAKNLSRLTVFNEKRGLC